MKDKKQIIIIILLVAVIVGMCILHSGQKRLEQRLESIDRNIYNNVQNAMGNVGYQIEQSLQNDKYLVTDVSETFPKAILRGETMAGDIYFELMENKDLENIYVIIQGENADDMMKIEAEDLGSLRYKVHVELSSLNDYEYYVLGETKNDGEIMLSRKSYLDMRYRVMERAYLSMKGAGSSSSRIYFKGVLQIHESLDYEKVELAIVKFREYDGRMEDIADLDVIRSVDITDILTETNDPGIIYDMPYEYDYDWYKTYSIDAEYKAKEGEDLLMYDEDFRIIVTLSDGSKIVLF